MALITWSDDYRIGIDVIDQDHRLLVSLLNQLDDATNGGQGIDVVSAVLRVLIDYTHSHFTREELLMQKADYPDYANHCAQHRALSIEVKRLMSCLEVGDDSGLNNELLDHLRTWLADHIAGADAALAPYVAGLSLSLDEQMIAVEQLKHAS